MSADSSAPARTAAALSASTLVPRLVAAAIIIAGLYFGRDLLIPLALAILLGFVLDPLVTRLRRWRVPRVAAVTAVIAATLALGAATTYFVATQVRVLATDLPVYQINISAKLKAFRTTLEQPGVLDQLSKVAGAVQRELDAAQRELEARSRTTGAKPPERVEVVPAPPTALERLGGWIEGILAPAATAGIVIVFLVLILLDTGDLRDRLLRLLGGNLHRTTDALSEAGRRVSRYLTMQLVVNATYGLPMAVGLWAIGVPGAMLWGLVAALMRFVPYVGPVVAAVFPVTLAFAMDPGWSMTLWTISLIVALELLSNNVIEPWLYGSSTGLSPLSLIIAATFWTAIWGPAGLVMSTPITVVLLVVGRYLPQLQFLDILLGSRPALDTPTRLYQRLLAGAAEEAVDLASEMAEKKSPQAFYNDAAVPALRIASEAHATSATAEHRLRVVSGMESVIEELREQYPADADLPAQVVCIGGRWEVDALAAEMAAHALALAGHPSRVAPGGAVSADYFARLDLGGAQLVCLSYFTPEPDAHARYMARRLKRRWPDVQVVLAIWNAPQPDAGAALLQQTGADAVALSLDELVATAGQLLAGEAAPPFAPAALPDDDLARVQALRDSGALGEHLRPIFDALAKRAADVFDTALAQVSLIDEEQQIAQGTSVPVDAQARATPRAQSMCAHAVAASRTLVVPDVLRDPRFASNPLLRERAIRFYAGVPLRDADGHVLGTLCLLDTQPRSLNPREVLLLETMAGDVMAAIKQAAVDQREQVNAEAAAQPGTPAR